MRTTQGDDGLTTPPGRKWGDVRQRDTRYRARYDGTYATAYHAMLYTLPGSKSAVGEPVAQVKPSRPRSSGERSTWRALNGAVWEKRPSPEELGAMRVERTRQKEERQRVEATRSMRRDQIRTLVAEGERRAEQQRLKHQ